jgi:hypothetical protein
MEEDFSLTLEDAFLTRLISKLDPKLPAPTVYRPGAAIGLDNTTKPTQEVDRYLGVTSKEITLIFPGLYLSDENGYPNDLMISEAIEKFDNEEISEFHLSFSIGSHWGYSSERLNKVDIIVSIDGEIFGMFKTEFHDVIIETTRLHCLKITFEAGPIFDQAREKGLATYLAVG